MIKLPRIARPLLLAAASVAAAWVALPKPPLLDGVSFSRCVLDRDGHLLRVTLSADEKFRMWTALAEISPELVSATLAYEDKHYARHPGVNPIALARSAFDLVRFRRAIAGGSTITMQVARLRFHLHTRSVTGKIVQIVRALELERHYSKREILEAYLNLAPYGRNIEGAGAASQLCFGKLAAQLTQPEAVALSVIPQSPTRRALLANRENRSIRVAQNSWYDHAAKSGAERSGRDFVARIEPERELLAPHFVQQALEMGGDRRRIETTLDLGKQRLIEKRISDYIASSHKRGIRNAAVVLVDSHSMEVLAQAGSADFNNRDIDGQVDGTRSRRSPGSTLKPFVYALAIDQGLIHPLSILSDAPRSFGEYNPENFDREFVGPIRACDALARSRNVPAVELASQLKQPTLYGFLQRADVALPKPESFYGLALPLGGAEVCLQDLVKLYAAVANNGELRPLRHLRSSAESNSASSTFHARQILSPEAAFLTLEMLGNVPRPEMNCASGDRLVFWKTGTSHGFRDAWSIAVFDHYVLGVWIGNFDGKANPEFIGRSAAGPLLFQIIDALRAAWPEAEVPHLPPVAANLKSVEFCAVSGDLPTPFCSHRVNGWFIPGVSPIKTCEVHREVLLDAASGLRVPSDDGTRAVRREVYEFWPGDLLALFERAGLARTLPPPFAPGTATEILGRSGAPPKILGAAAGEKLSGTIPLSAKADGDVREIYWFANAAFIGKSDARSVLTWSARSGDYELTALDDHGRATSSHVVVR